MPSLLRRIIDLFRSYHQLRYLVVAGCTALGYVGLVALGLWIGWHYMIAILVAQAITIACAFPAYRNLVFHSRGTIWADFVRFLSVWASGAIAGLVATPFLVEVFGMPPLFAQVLAIVVIAVASYLGHRFFSFRDREPEHDARPPAQEPSEHVTKEQP
ncbi:GtrA family protein [Enemella sp. A6]|uniref:GtrA family protein n=1 Tax=Enemella sp. A6 TaxID=3440152 RepID=UPI003EBA88EB